MTSLSAWLAHMTHHNCNHDWRLLSFPTAVTFEGFSGIGAELGVVRQYGSGHGLGEDKSQSRKIRNSFQTLLILLDSGMSRVPAQLQGQLFLWRQGGKKTAFSLSSSGFSYYYHLTIQYSDANRKLN